MLLNPKSSLYILDMGPLQTCDLQIFPPILYGGGGVPFDTHKFLILMKSTLSVILLVIHAIGVPSKIHCLSKDMIQIYTFL